MRSSSTTVDSAGRIMIGRGGDLTKSKRLTAVTPDIHKEYDDKSAQSAGGWTIFCSNFNRECTADDMREVFEEFGDVISIKADFDQITMESRGYFLVKYKTRESADSAIADLNNTKVHGQVISVSFAFRNHPLNSMSVNSEDDPTQPRKRLLEAAAQE